VVDVELIELAGAVTRAAEAKSPAYRIAADVHLATQPMLLATLCVMRVQGWAAQDAEWRLRKDPQLCAALGLEHAADRAAVMLDLHRLGAVKLRKVLEGARIQQLLSEAKLQLILHRRGASGELRGPTGAAPSGDAPQCTAPASIPSAHARPAASGHPSARPESAADLLTRGAALASAQVESPAQRASFVVTNRPSRPAAERLQPTDAPVSAPPPPIAADAEGNEPAPDSAGDTAPGRSPASMTSVAADAGDAPAHEPSGAPVPPPPTSPAAGQSQTIYVTVPDRPALADDVRLLGPMKDGGFKSTMWLAQRGDRFVQLTELLYRIAEQADGTRPLAEIAAAVSRSTGRTVSASNVRTLIGARLMPLGLLAAPEDSPLRAAVSRRPTTGRSPLGVNMHLAKVGPRVIEPLTRVLQVFFWSPIVMSILVLVALTHWWLYFAHGVGDSLLETIYRPELILVLVPLTLLACIFHELGHASALRYGGGRARAIGVGYYLIYPTFYTDVTDSYRLGRWARVRTDLGGFYFNLIFALAVTAIYALTRWEFLLAVVLWTDLEIVDQCLPFVRFDGYWVLTDLTGVPDFLSLVGPFLRSVVPLPRWKGAKLPDLKPWVKGLFAVYLVVTIPLLVCLLLLFVVSVPRIFATIWDSLSQQLNAFAAAQIAGNRLAMATAALGIALLGLTALGVCVGLLQFGRIGLKWLGKFSRPTPLRRATGAAATIAVAALLLFLWAPQPALSAVHSLLSRVTLSSPRGNVSAAPTAPRHSGAAAVPPSQTPACATTPYVFFDSASASDAAPTAGETIQFSVTIRANCPASSLIDFEVFNAAGDKVWQESQDDQQLTRQPQTFVESWAIPPSEVAGVHTVLVGVYSPGFGQLYGSNVAAKLTVGSRQPETTDQAAPEPTHASTSSGDDAHPSAAHGDTPGQQPTDTPTPKPGDPTPNAKSGP
jgi:hypothetical protein